MIEAQLAVGPRASGLGILIWAASLHGVWGNWKNNVQKYLYSARLTQRVRHCQWVCRDTVLRAAVLYVTVRARKNQRRPKGHT
jgi:hypothetical protein